MGLPKLVVKLKSVFLHFNLVNWQQFCYRSFNFPLRPIKRDLSGVPTFMELIIFHFFTLASPDCVCFRLLSEVTRRKQTVLRWKIHGNNILKLKEQLLKLGD